MARDHARISTAILDDPDYLALNSVQQNLYLASILAKDLSWCGVTSYAPARFVGIASDITRPKVIQGLKVLEDKRFLVIDRDTSEILVRTYVRHDGIMKQPNVAKACAKAVNRVYSPLVRASIVTELARLWEENPEARGWVGFSEADPELFELVLSKAS